MDDIPNETIEQLKAVNWDKVTNSDTLEFSDALKAFDVALNNHQKQRYAFFAKLITSLIVVAGLFLFPTHTWVGFHFVVLFTDISLFYFLTIAAKVEINTAVILMNHTVKNLSNKT